MPHDNKGRKIEFGDWIKARPYNFAEKKIGDKNAPVVGRVVQMREGQTCSGDMIWNSLDGVRKDSFGADESEIVLKADGSEPAQGSTTAA